jgi:acyl-coenzyme A thioesterase PaaI-like protein
MQIRGLGKVIKKGKRIISVQGEIYDDENALVATGSGSIIPIDL